MRIKKTYRSAVQQGKVLNARSTSQDNTYSCDYLNKRDTYSTTEQVVGTWIDGKPIYRKVIVTNNLSTGSNTINLSSLNIDYLSIDYILDTGLYRLKYYDDDMKVWYQTDNKIMYANPGSWTGKFTIILEYTKTTD